MNNIFILLDMVYRNYVFHFYFLQELSEGVSMLGKLLSLHEQNLEFESNLAEFYLHRCQAIALKVKYVFFIFVIKEYECRLFI